MVDMTALTAIHGSAATADRIKRRRRAETRLKAYGIAAIGLAALALVALLSSVFVKASGALTESYVTLSVDLSSDKVDLSDPGEGNYSGLMKDTMKEVFPYVTSRSDRRELYGLISSGASFELADEIEAAAASLTPESEFSFPFLLSDDADLYFKGFFGELTSEETEGALSISGA
ncbi:MAG: DUF3333 domain-containing protein, partial [Pseudomonadota bacterium]